MDRVLVFEDPAVSQLAPITTSRPGHSILCGGNRLLDWLRRLGAPVLAAVRPHLRGVLAEDAPDLTGDGQVNLMVNACLVPSRQNFETLRTLLREQRPCVVRAGDRLAAVVPARPRLASTVPAPWSGALDEPLPESTQHQLSLFEYPHDVVRWNMLLLPDSLQDRLATHGDSYCEQRPGLFVAPGVKIAESMVCDTSAGPILVEQGASIGPHTFLSGPGWIGANTRLIEHASIKDGCCIGHTVKIGGEVEASIIEGYSNKQHYGFLGHSYLGSWINLGAGTCNSDLKNTYGEINMEYGGRRVASGMQFMGCVIGDYAKTAINTGIFTGKLVGVGSMVYGFVTTNVPSFVNYARLFGQVSEIPPDVLIATQKRMFQRRKVEQRECDQQLIRDMHRLTIDERQLTGEQLSL
ncbi:MAG: hypothetical protein KDB14_15670 [Planctomycetales bacterium]|nr:hypothetical protein [Planctomycetales bacterium]